MCDNKVKWINNNNIWELHFEPFYEDEILAIVYQTEDSVDDEWFYESGLLLADDDYFEEDNSLEYTKTRIEERIEEHYQDVINYYTSLLENFKERD